MAVRLSLLQAAFHDYLIGVGEIDTRGPPPLLWFILELYSEISIISAYLSQYIPIHSYGISMEISLSIIFVTLVIYALLLPVLYIFRVFVGTILTPNWTPFPRQGDGIVVGIVALIAVIIVIDFIRFTGGGL